MGIYYEFWLTGSATKVIKLTKEEVEANDGDLHSLLYDNFFSNL